MEKGLQRFMKVCSKPNRLGLHCEAMIFCSLIIVSDVERYCVNIWTHNFLQRRINVVSDNGETLDFQI